MGTANALMKAFVYARESNRAYGRLDYKAFETVFE